MQNMVWVPKFRKCPGLPRWGKEVVRESFVEYLVYKLSFPGG